MVDGREYESIVGVEPKNPEVQAELRRALADLEAIRGRPCVCYVANMVRAEYPNRSIESSDFLPFVEMINAVPLGQRAVDILLATPGGLCETVNQLVEATRARFDDVAFIIPAQAMSAGTLWALSGDSIWMSDRAYLGPIDPQVPGKDGRYLPIQALLTLLDAVQKAGEQKIANGQQPDWSHLVLLKNMDQKELGAALTSSQYVVSLATQFIEKYKFRHWDIHSSSGQPVTAAERHVQAQGTANALCSHERWKAHGHAINRDVLKDDLGLRIDRPETVDGLDRAIKRLWALWYYTLDKTVITKAILSRDYAYFRNAAVAVGGQ